MELINSSSPYLSQPNSPENFHFYTAPTSPMGRIYGNESDSNAYKTDEEDDGGFEFETSQRFNAVLRCHSSQTFDYCVVGNKQFDRANSLSTMAFANELFYNGHVLPLKLPPRLQKHGTNSIPTSPKSPLRISLSRRSTWNDNFDPFMIALEKVSDEPRGSVHRRSHSHSPFRTTPINDDSDDLIINQIMEETKESSYDRWVRSQTTGHKQSTLATQGSYKGLTKAKILLGSKRASENQVGFIAESKMQKLKSILLKYTSFRKENHSIIEATTATSMKTHSSYFKKLSFKFKGGNEKKKGCTSDKSAGESKIMTLVKYNPKLPLCLGYVPASPTHH